MPTLSFGRTVPRRSRFPGTLPLRGLAWLLWLGTAFAFAALPLPNCAAGPLVTIGTQSAGPTPFIATVRLRMDDTSLLDYVQFTVAPKTGSVTRAVSARYSFDYLMRRGYVSANRGLIKVPVFCLYANYTNEVTLVSGFVDGSSQTNTVSIKTARYKSSIYNHPTVVQARSTTTALSYDFIMLKTFNDGASPKILDTDGELRWVGTANVPSMMAIFYDNSFFIQTPTATGLQRMEFDGSFTTVADYAADGVTLLHHNFDFGKSGILMSVNTAAYFESTVMEVDLSGNILHTWDLASIITDAMVAGGDDPTKFVAVAGSQYDWFHNNSTTYRPSDDSLIVSSRENFVIALDYETGAIKWIFGDPTKQWFEFPSLAKYALTATVGTTYPAGQHALSFNRDHLLLFDNGYGSADHMPTGVTRTYSAPRKYAIDEAAGTVAETWNYLAGETKFSPITSSVYEDQRNDYLIDYAVEGPYLFAELIGLSPGGDTVFDYEFTGDGTPTVGWNAVVLHLENLVFN